MSGRQSHLAVLADCERALGRPERAIDIFRTADRRLLSDEEAAELLIVAAGARADLGQREAAAAMLQVPQLSGDQPWVARLRYAYADALLALGRTAEARDWFARAVDLDPEATTDAAERLLELEGVVLDEAEDTDAEDTDADDPDAQQPDAEESDGGPSDAEESDGGPSDAEENDAGENDTEESDGAEPGNGPATEEAGAGAGDAAVDESGDRGYSVDGANPDGAVGGAGPAEIMSDVEGAVAYDDDDLEDFDDDDDLDDEDLDDLDDDLDDEDIDDDDDLDDDFDDDDEFDDDELDEDEDDDFDDELDDDDLADDDLDDDLDEDEFDDEGDEDGARSPR